MNVNTPPYLSQDVSVRRVMLQVLLALVPGIAAYVWFFGAGILVQLAIASAAALAGEAAMLAFLFSISEGLEEYSLARTRRGLRALLSLVPDEATVRRDGTETTIAPTELRIGDLMVVKPGERVATDGIITRGRTALDLSAITGESVPVEAGPGDEVFAGSINGTGVLEVQVTTTAEDNSLARIVHIVETEAARRGATQRLADRAAGWLFWYALGAAVLTAVVWTLLGASGMFEAINAGLTMLLSSDQDQTSVRLEDFVNTNKVMGFTALFSVINVVILTALGTIFAFLYNLSANILGGLELTLAED